jgi:Flp pilus assembly protein TadG
MKVCKVLMTAAAYMPKITRHFVRDSRGVAGLEFALIAPILILLWLGSIEVTGGIDVNKNLGRATSMVADLVTQQQSITQAQIAGIMDIGRATLLPYQRDTPQITITAINVSSAGAATVAWSRRRVNGTDTTPFQPGTAVALDANLIIPGTSVIRVQMNIAYVPLIAWTIEGQVNTAAGDSVVGLSMAKTSFGRVRQGGAVTCSNCS